MGVLDRQKEPIEAEASGARKRIMKDANGKGGRASSERPCKLRKGIWIFFFSAGGS